VLPTVDLSPAEPCISCGWCADVCPTRLRPVHLMQLAQRSQNDQRLVEQINWCIDCGLCSHVCPVSLPLAQTLRAAAAGVPV
jgi:electron transport complex protein RnfC